MAETDPWVIFASILVRSLPAWSVFVLTGINANYRAIMALFTRRILACPPKQYIAKHPCPSEECSKTHRPDKGYPAECLEEVCSQGVLLQVFTGFALCPLAAFFLTTDPLVMRTSAGGFGIIVLAAVLAFWSKAKPGERFRSLAGRNWKHILSFSLAILSTIAAYYMRT